MPEYCVKFLNFFISTFIKLNPFIYIFLVTDSSAFQLADLEQTLHLTIHKLFTVAGIVSDLVSFG